jgi:hypothetical protein
MHFLTLISFCTSYHCLLTWHSASTQKISGVHDSSILLLMVIYTEQDSLQMEKQNQNSIKCNDPIADFPCSGAFWITLSNSKMIVKLEQIILLLDIQD